MTPAVARASAGAIEHLPIAVVTNLARYLEEVKGPELWVYGAAGDGETSMWDADLAGGVALVFGAEGKGLRPLVRRTLRRARLDPARRRGRVAERQRRRGAAPVTRRAASADGVVADADALPLRRLQPAPRRAVRRPPRARRRARELRRDERRARRGRLRRRRRRRRASARSRCASRPTPTRCSSGSRPSTASRERVLLVSSDATVLGTAGREVANLSSQTFFRDLVPAERAAATARRSRRQARRGDARKARTPTPGE